MVEMNVNENVPVVVLGTAVKAVYSAGESKQIQKAVMDELLLPSTEPYHKVNVVVKHRRDGKPEALIAYMLRAYTYTADIARIDIDEKYAVRGVELSYVEEEEVEYAAAPRAAGHIVKPKVVDMVFSTPVPEIVTAKQGVETAYKIATSAGYKCVKLLGKDANLTNYKHFLSGHLKGFGNIGHGWTEGIVLADGNLTYKWFSSLGKKALCPEVIYFNSCQVFNSPLQPAIMKAGARTFVGGKVNLLIGPSEEVFKCFWTKVLKGKEKMGVALRTCERAKYPVANAHGISGDVGKFLPIPKC
ncbi:MAG: hypothetical protein A4E35_01599 [Methanoregula sp. PtaU1.Bin051]|nr:MAG: hypothetical protein A4E35_01599 [Methanoregula sp. PtaU1.Bin051]